MVLYLKYFLHNAMLTRYFFHSCVQNIFPYSSEIFKVTPEVIYIWIIKFKQFSESKTLLYPLRSPKKCLEKLSHFMNDCRINHKILYEWNNISLCVLNALTSLVFISWTSINNLLIFCYIFFYGRLNSYTRIPLSILSSNKATHVNIDYYT